MVPNKCSRNLSRPPLFFLFLVLAVFLTLPVIVLAEAGPAERPTLAPAPTWELNDLTGEAHRLEDWRGKWVLMKLGTTGCPVCGRELEEIAKVEDQLAQLNVEILDIYLREDRYFVKKYWRKKDLGFQPTILYDWRGRLIRDYGVSEIPHLVLVDPEGRIAWEATYTPGPELVNALGYHVRAGSIRDP